MQLEMKQILKSLEARQTLNITLAIAKLAVQSKSNLNELIESFIKTKSPMKERIAWCISHCFDLDSNCLNPYLPVLSDIYMDKKNHQAVDRNLSRIFSLVKPKGEPWEEIVIDKSFKIIYANDYPIATVCNAMLAIYNLGTNHHEILHELGIYIQSKIIDKKPAFKTRGNYILGELRKKKLA